MEKLFDAEIKLMEIIWEREPVPAKEVGAAAAQSFGWNKNTTYTVLKRLVEKGVLERADPGFVCRSVLKKADVQKTETRTLIDKLFGGSKKAFFAAFADEQLSDDEIETLKQLIEKS